MPRSPLVGRRIHISGGVASDPAYASVEDVRHARETIRELVSRLVGRGANFVVPVDRENTRDDGEPMCFDWLVWQTLRDNLASRPRDARGVTAVAVLHHKNEDQVPPEFRELWDGLRDTDHVEIESAAQWNMNGKRMEVQAGRGDVLITLGGDEGVRFLAELYHGTGRPVIPLPLPICEAHKGSRALYGQAEAAARSHRFFRTVGSPSQTWVNRLRMSRDKSPAEHAERIVTLLEDLRPRQAFAVRLLNRTHPDFADVDSFFESIVKPVVEDELGFELAVVDGLQPFNEPRIDGEIFERLHRSALVVADCTGERPNCFIELGYALGRGIPTVVTAREGTTKPFDVGTLATHDWTTAGTVAERRESFRRHLDAVRNRPALVSSEPLTS